MKSKATILLVDDNATHRSAVREGLEIAGYKVTEAESRATALQQVESAKPDLAIVDVRLLRDDDPHDFDGLRLLTQLPKSLPTIILSSHKNAEAMARVYMLPEDVPRPKAFLFKDGDINAVIANAKLALSKEPGRPTISLALRRSLLAVSGLLLLYGIYSVVDREFFMGVASSLVASALFIFVEKYFSVR